MKLQFFYAVGLSIIAFTLSNRTTAASAEDSRGSKAQRDCENYARELDYSNIQGLLKASSQREPARYPKVSRLEEYACVATQMDIDGNGTPVNIMVVFEAPAGIDKKFGEASIQATSKWRYEWMTKPNLDAAKAIIVMHHFVLAD